MQAKRSPRRIWVGRSTLLLLEHVIRTTIGAVVCRLLGRLAIRSLPIAPIPLRSIPTTVLGIALTILIIGVASIKHGVRSIRLISHWAGVGVIWRVVVVGRWSIA